METLESLLATGNKVTRAVLNHFVCSVTGQKRARSDRVKDLLSFYLVQGEGEGEQN